MPNLANDNKAESLNLQIQIIPRQETDRPTNAQLGSPKIEAQPALATKHFLQRAEGSGTSCTVRRHRHSDAVLQQLQEAEQMETQEPRALRGPQLSRTPHGQIEQTRQRY